MQENTANSEKNWYPFFDYLKALAIICIVIDHYRFTISELGNLLFPYAIEMGVPIFMLVTGFLYANSFLKNKIYNIKEMFAPAILIKRFLRLTLPFLIIFTIEYIFNTANIREHDNFFINLFNGQIGPGSYYFPVILQVIIFFPILYVIALKYKFRGFFIIILFEFLYMLFSVKFSVNPILFRSLAFRFLTLVYFGCWFAIYKAEIKNIYLMLSLFTGIFYIFWIYYEHHTNFFYPYIPEFWSLTSGIFITLYIFPVFYWLYKYLITKNFNNIFEKFLALIGKASWHIFVMQMLYFVTLDLYLYSLNLYLHIIFNIFVCSILGILFYLIENIFKAKFVK